MQVVRDEKARQSIVKWLDGLLAHNPSRWTLLFLHFPLFSSEPTGTIPKCARRSSR
jgi:hypothetical protein